MASEAGSPPGFFSPAGGILLWALSWLAMESEVIPWAAYILQGLQPAVLAIVSAAVIRLASRTLTSPLQWIIAIAALALVAIHAPFPLVLVGAGLIGALLLKKRKTIEPGSLPSPSRASVGPYPCRVGLFFGGLPCC